MIGLFYNFTYLCVMMMWFSITTTSVTLRLQNIFLAKQNQKFLKMYKGDFIYEKYFMNIHVYLCLLLESLVFWVRGVFVVLVLGCLFVFFPVFFFFFFSSSENVIFMFVWYAIQMRLEIVLRMMLLKYPAKQFGKVVLFLIEITSLSFFVYEYYMY